MAECQYNTIIVTTSNGDVTATGTYTKSGTFNNYSLYENSNGWQITCSPAGPPGWAAWQISKEGSGYYAITNLGPNQPDCPPEGNTDSGGGGGSGVLTLAYGGSSSAPTFGLPSDVVALITSRFGTVANFLRLRNQGQV